MRQKPRLQDLRFKYIFSLMRNEKVSGAGKKRKNAGNSIIFAWEKEDLKVFSRKRRKSCLQDPRFKYIFRVTRNLERHLYIKIKPRRHYSIHLVSFLPTSKK